MSRIKSVIIVDNLMRTTYDDDYFNELIIPNGYKVQVRIVKETIKKECRHYRYAICNVADKAIVPHLVYGMSEVTCKICLQAIKQNALKL